MFVDVLACSLASLWDYLWHPEGGETIQLGCFFHTFKNV